MQVRVLDTLEAISPEAWNRLAGTANPFLRHEFLAALERHGCVGANFGWYPRFVLVVDDDPERPLAAAPLYIKTNSYGEFVFDWAWADAYERAGLRYYPKLVAAVPYTPATGPRLLLDPDTPERHEALTGALLEGVDELARELAVSSTHWLFPTGADMERLRAHDLMVRVGCQFQWFNHGYRDFDDFLASFTAQKRKKVKRERRYVRESGLAIDVVHGHEASTGQIEAAAHFYTTTFDKKWGVATLNLGFFQEVARTMGEQLVLVLAREGSRHVAGAICFRGEDALYGRHWGCDADYHSLHFELCYYQGIDYAIRHGLARFEPGAQGEHKISRGFVPTPTWSAHWIAEPDFRRAIADFLARETDGMEYYMKELEEHSPYKA